MILDATFLQLTTKRFFRSWMKMTFLT